MGPASAFSQPLTPDTFQFASSGRRPCSSSCGAGHFTVSCLGRLLFWPILPLGYFHSPTIRFKSPFMSPILNSGKCTYFFVLPIRSFMIILEKKKYPSMFSLYSTLVHMRQCLVTMQKPNLHVKAIFVPQCTACYHFVMFCFLF